MADPHYAYECESENGGCGHPQQTEEQLEQQRVENLLTVFHEVLDPLPALDQLVPVAGAAGVRAGDGS